MRQQQQQQQAGIAWLHPTGIVDAAPSRNVFQHRGADRVNTGPSSVT